MEDGMTFGKVELNGDEQFQTLRRTLGVTSFGLNVISLQPRQRLRIHRHLQQEEVYIVLAGTLTLTIEANHHRLGVGDAARVAPAVKRQLVNTDPGLCVILALGGAGVHEGRDGEAFVNWDDLAGRPPQDVPLPPDLPA